MAHGGERMAASTSLTCLNRLVFPLLSDVLENKQHKSEGVSGTQLGTDKGTGKAVMMAAHYTRDTAEKQWDETRVFALQVCFCSIRLALCVLSVRSATDWLCRCVWRQGVAAVMRQFVEVLYTQPSFADSWRRFLAVMEVAQSTHLWL